MGSFSLLQSFLLPTFVYWGCVWFLRWSRKIVLNFSPHLKMCWEIYVGFMLRRVVVFSCRSAYIFSVTSTMRVLLRAVFTDLGAMLAERNLSIAKGQSLVMGFSSIESWTIMLGKKVDTSFISLSLYVSAKVSVSGRDLLGNLFDIHWVFLFFWISHVWGLAFHQFCAPLPTKKSNFCWELTKEGTLFTWLRQGYTTSILESSEEPQTPADPRQSHWILGALWFNRGQSPILSTRLPSAIAFYDKKKCWVFVCHECNWNTAKTKHRDARTCHDQSIDQIGPVWPCLTHLGLKWCVAGHMITQLPDQGQLKHQDSILKHHRSSPTANR